MPFKANAASRHHIPKQKRRVTNWAAYDASLRQRGSLTIWFSDQAIAALSRRAETPEVPRPCAGSAAGNAPIHLLVDSTGLKLRHGRMAGREARHQDPPVVAQAAYRPGTPTPARSTPLR